MEATHHPCVGEDSEFWLKFFSHWDLQKGYLWIKKPTITTTSGGWFLTMYRWSSDEPGNRMRRLRFWISKNIWREHVRVQVALYENIESYLKSGRDGFESYFTGQMLCIVALICWYLMVAKEAGSGSWLVKHLECHPSGRKLGWHQGVVREGGKLGNKQRPEACESMIFLMTVTLPWQTSGNYCAFHS